MLDWLYFEVDNIIAPSKDILSDLFLSISAGLKNQLNCDPTCFFPVNNKSGYFFTG